MHKFKRWSENGVVLVSEVAETNPPLSHYLQENIEELNKRDGDFKVLDDTKPIRGKFDVYLYVKRYFGNTVNISVLRRDHRNVYFTITHMGDVFEVLKDMGFDAHYSSKYTDEDLKEALSRVSRGGVVESLPKSLDNRLRYRAYRDNKTLREVVEELGYHLAYKGVDY